MFCAEIFPNLAGREIRRGQNVNEVLTSKLLGNADRLKSADEIVNNQDLLRFNIEYLHTLNPNGFPNHDLCLKKNMLHHQMHRQQTSGMQGCWIGNLRVVLIPESPSYQKYVSSLSSGSAGSYLCNHYQQVSGPGWLASGSGHR